MGRRPVTLQTIADRLGVSRTTVSNAYNRPDQLAPELRERVLATAAELGYAGPDAAARRLRSGGPEAVGLLFTESLAYAFSDPAAVLFLQGFARASEAAGLAVLVLPGARGRAEPHGAVRDAVVDGFCAYSLPDDSPELKAAVARRLPIVLVDEPRLPGHAFVGVDDRAGARAVAEHVAGLGHRRLGVVSFRTADDGHRGPLTAEREAATTYAVTSARLNGWRDGVEAAGLEWDAVVKEEVLINSADDGETGLRALLERDPEITAVLCSADAMALGARRAATALGRRLPEDLSIAGFDDIPAAALAGLTTARQPLLEKGLTAGRLLIEPGDGPAEVILPVELVVRGSTAPPRATA